MRVAFAHWTSRLAGGTEQYLRSVAGALAERGHSVSLVHEADEPPNRESIMTEGVPVWNLSELGESAVLNRLRSWEPDVIYVQMLREPSHEKALRKSGPAALRFVHDYSGTCISGYKTHHFPVPRPCSRKFGSACLLHFYPRRCGGLNPLTAWRDYVTNLERLEQLRGYDAVLTNSSHMVAEHARNGIVSTALPFAVPERPNTDLVAIDQHAECSSRLPNRILFAGRMDKLKGGQLLIGAVQRVAADLNRPITLTLAGDGPAQAAWRMRADEINHARSDLSIHVTGWLDRQEMQRQFRCHDVLAVPSIWPEPLGAVGIEAGLAGLPAVAFASGGIGDWLVDGVNGFLAPANPPTSEGLAKVLVKALQHGAVQQELREGALLQARRHSLDQHVSSLLQLFEKVVRTPSLIAVS